MRVLIVEDSERLRRSLGKGLEKQGWAVDLAADGREGFEFALAYEYDAIVLDLMLPAMSGLEVLRQLREHGRDTHVLILSALDEVADRVQGLATGADDYLVKPFAFDELAARLQALARRRYRAKNPTLRLGRLEVDLNAKSARLDGEPRHLTPHEYAVLEILLLRRGRVVSQEQLIEHLYSSEAEISSNVIEVLISGLRKKIHAPGTTPIIRTRRGHGYVIEA